MTTTKIGARRVPVAPGATVAHFSSGRLGRKEAGVYLFWTAIFCVGRGSNRSGVFGRAKAGLAPGERFRRMEKEMRTASSKEDRAAYRRMWRKLQRVVEVRPSKPNEVARWLSSHEEDAQFLKRLEFI